MMETLLVTGVHREELGFGDRVSELLDRQRIHVMRIPKGISHSRTGTNGLFYYNTRHREIYLQLRQQVKGHYGLLLDLHCGLNDSGRCADIYCRDERILRCIAARSKPTALGEQLRLVKILTDVEESESAGDGHAFEIGARTPIPQQIWNDRTFVYVGLEIYLAQKGEGGQEDWRFARNLIDTVQDCVASGEWQN